MGGLYCDDADVDQAGIKRVGRGYFIEEPGLQARILVVGKKSYMPEKKDLLSGHVATH